MDRAPPERVERLRSLISTFLTERLSAKLDKLPDDDPNRAELAAKYQLGVWLEDAAKRVAQIQAVTHTLKAVHPDARGTSLHAPPNGLAALQVVGSHCLGESYALDVVGNAAALDVYKFLRLEYQQQNLLYLACTGDADLAAALSDDPDQALAWMQAFAALLEPKSGLASHALAKQLYWPLDPADVHTDDNFHLLEPLYASALAHQVYLQVQADRFGDDAKAARDAKKANALHDDPVRSYPNLAVQKMGGTKPQNISQLNSERGGNNYLLASAPPQWLTVPKPLHKVESLFNRLGFIPEVKRIVRALIRFLQTEPDPVKATRDTRDGYLEQLIDEFLVFTCDLRRLEPGWSQHEHCQLVRHHRYWLDPLGAKAADDAIGEAAPTDLLERISQDFAAWFNQQLQDSPGGALPVGDPEYQFWRRQVFDALKAFEREGGDFATSQQDATKLEASHV